MCDLCREARIKLLPERRAAMAAMRRPTPPEIAYKWHRAALEGMKPFINRDEPQCGYFVCKTRSRDLPASIYLDRTVDPETGELTSPEVLKCEVAGAEKDPAKAWPFLAATPISEQDYLDMVAGAAFGALPGRQEAKASAPETPKRDPRLPY